MSNIRNTSPKQADLLGAIIDRLNGTVSMVSKLRISLDKLETELNQIREQCENAIHTHLPILSVDKADDKGRDTPKLQSHLSHGAKIPPGSVSLQNWSRNPDRSKLEEPKELQGEGHTESPRSESKLDPGSNPTTKKDSMKNQPKGHSTLSFRIPRIFSRISPGRGLSTGIVIEEGDNLTASCSRSRTAVAEAEVQGTGVLVPPCRLAGEFPLAEQNRPAHPPRPPTNPFPFPEDIDLSSYPPELKREGDNWFILFNPSPKVKRVLDVNLVHVLAHDSWVYCVRFSRDGQWVATGCRRTTQIYDVKTGNKTCVLDYAQDVYIRSICFSPDGKYLATGAMNNQIRIWNIAERQIYSTFEGQGQATVCSLDFSPNGQILTFGSDDGSIRMWDVHGRISKVITIDGHFLPDGHHGVWSVAISPDGRFVAVGSYDSVVSIWEVPTGVFVQMLRGHDYGVSSVAFTPDGRRLISGGYDHTLKCWDMSGLDIGSGASTAPTSTSITSSSPCVMNLTSHNDSVNSIAVSQDGTWAVSGSDDGNILFWDMRTGVAQCILSGHKGRVCQVDFSPMRNHLATVAWDGQVMIWSYGICE